MADHVSLREFIERIITENNKHRDDLRREDNLRLDERFAALARALSLQSVAYPTVKDFNDLKTHVDVELASRSGSSNVVATLFQVLTVLSLVSSSIFAYLLYTK